MSYPGSPNLYYGQREFAVCHRELNSLLGDSLEGWDGVGVGREEVQEGGDICRPMTDSC